ncbi:hypothetical protein ARSEF1564_004255 [Beauveria bassiana]
MRDGHRLEKNTFFVGRRAGTSEDKTLKADALLQRALTQEPLAYAHSLATQELKHFDPFDLPNTQKEGYESLDMARDAIALATARSLHMREEIVLFDHGARVTTWIDRTLEIYALTYTLAGKTWCGKYEKSEMSLEVWKGKDPHLFLVDITLMSAANAELARVAPHEVDKSRIESRIRKRRLPEGRSFLVH